MNKLSKFAGVAKSVVGLEPRPCDTKAFDRNTAPMQMGHVAHRGKSDIKLASNRHMAFGIDCREATSDTLKTPGHIDNPVRLIFLYIRPRAVLVFVCSAPRPRQAKLPLSVKPASGI